MDKDRNVVAIIIEGQLIQMAQGAEKKEKEITTAAVRRVYLEKEQRWADLTLHSKWLVDEQGQLKLGEMEVARGSKVIVKDVRTGETVHINAGDKINRSKNKADEEILELSDSKGNLKGFFVNNSFIAAHDKNTKYEVARMEATITGLNADGTKMVTDKVMTGHEYSREYDEANKKWTWNAGEKKIMGHTRLQGIYHGCRLTESKEIVNEHGRVVAMVLGKHQLLQVQGNNVVIDRTVVDDLQYQAQAAYIGVYQQKYAQGSVVTSSDGKKTYLDAKKFAAIVKQCKELEQSIQTHGAQAREAEKQGSGAKKEMDRHWAATYYAQYQLEKLTGKTPTITVNGAALQDQEITEEKLLADLTENKEIKYQYDEKTIESLKQKLDTAVLREALSHRVQNQNELDSAVAEFEDFMKKNPLQVFFDPTLESKQGSAAVAENTRLALGINVSLLFFGFGDDILDEGVVDHELIGHYIDRVIYMAHIKGTGGATRYKHLAQADFRAQTGIYESGAIGEALANGLIEAVLKREAANTLMKLGNEEAAEHMLRESRNVSDRARNIAMKIGISAGQIEAVLSALSGGREFRWGAVFFHESVFKEGLGT
ncbi:MAG: hypothetical protein HQL13_05605 [Candidatus Omnitrophica bacterium]|nr:hypothetical protein [Candidatus Omnitrophota bacterium]